MSERAGGFFQARIHALQRRADGEIDIRIAEQDERSRRAGQPVYFGQAADSERLQRVLQQPARTERRYGEERAHVGRDGERQRGEYRDDSARGNVRADGEPSHRDAHEQRAAGGDEHELDGAPEYRRRPLAEEQRPHVGRRLEAAHGEIAQRQRHADCDEQGGRGEQRRRARALADSDARTVRERDDCHFG